jgi:Spy/CpxP family protein refolding chaperone
MRTKLLASLLVIVATALTATSEATESPYAGEQTRAIKALSADEIAALLSGQGMGFAKAAELNGYPGPAHVLELARQLHLNDEQLAATRALEAAMRSKARALGAALVDAESSLDALFAAGKIDNDELSAALLRIGNLQAQLRQTHLEAHLEQVKVLSETQVARYVELRGYGGAATHDGHAQHPGRKLL